MKETLHNAKGKDETRVRRAFRWVITFRDFPEGSWQTVDGDSMMTEALTYFTKGRAEFYLDGVRRRDRVPGTLSSEHELVGQGGTFTLKYVEPTTRLCIPGNINRDTLPKVTQHEVQIGDQIQLHGKYLVCRGSIIINEKIFKEEQTFQTQNEGIGTALEHTLLLEFHDDSPR